MGSKKDKDRRPFIYLLWDVVDSNAWEDISNAARVAYIHILRHEDFKDHEWRGKPTYKEMKKIMAEPTFAKAIDELVEVGLIEKKQIGQIKKKNFYRRSSLWEGYGIHYE